MKSHVGIPCIYCGANPSKSDWNCPRNDELIADTIAAEHRVQADAAKCRYCGSPMPKNEIRCKVCHP